MSSHKMLIQDVIEASADQDEFVARIRDDPQKLQVRTTDELPLAIVRYNKKYSNMEDALVRECRSVVVSKSPLRVVGWSPPKSGELPETMEDDEWENVSQSEFVDGTMVNVFFQEGDMWISTRSYLHATCRFQSSRTFAELFYETMGMMNMDFAKVPKDICMTFILKHPENRIVQYHARPGLVLVAAAKLTPSNGHVSFVPISDIRNKYELSCWYPRQYQFMNPQKVREQCLQPTLPPNFQGIMVTTSDGARQKFRNPTYNQVRLLRGNNRRMDQRFIQLLKDDKVMEYLKYFREERNEMWELRKKIQEVWRGVFAAYRDVFITRTKKVPEVNQEYRPVIIELHTHWKDVLRAEGKRVNYGVVRDFVTAYPVPKQLFLMNQGNREEGQDAAAENDAPANTPEGEVAAGGGAVGEVEDELPQAPPAAEL